MLDTFFHTVSKWTIIIPLGIVVIVLLLQPEKSNTLQQQTRTPTITEPVQVRQVAPTLSIQNIDLSKSYICKSGATTISLQNKQVFAETKDKNKTKNILFKQDCLYQWDKGSFNGTRICGLGQYVALYEQLSKLHLVSADTLVGPVLDIVQKQTSTQSADVKTATDKAKVFLQTCKEQTIKNQTVFEIPKSVLFKNAGQR